MSDPYLTTPPAASPDAETQSSLLPLSAKDISLTINNQHLLRDINLDIYNMGITAIMGHNGAGKSLLARVLHGILTPDVGTVTWSSHPVSELNVRLQQSMVFQKPVLLRRSVAANIDYVLRLRGNKNNHQRDKLLAAAELKHKANQQARHLSGGEQQRLAIARALATEPAVLLLDEPTASLDPAATKKIETLIQSSSNVGIKVILVTHDVAQAKRLANDVVLLSGGTVAEHTNAKTFFSSPQSSAGHTYLSGYLQPSHQTPAL